MISALNFKIGGGGGACADATVKNSDNTYSTTAASGSTLTLPNITVTDSDGSTSSVPAVKNVTCKLSPVGATLMKTGQTTSYRTGDDGDIEAGRATSFSVLASNNPFGNTNRFTDELGGQTYTNNIVIDWSTYNGANVLGVRRTQNAADITWSAAIDAALALSIGSFTSGWRLINRNEYNNFWNGESSLGLNYSPLNLTPIGQLWLSNTLQAASTLAWAATSYGQLAYFGKTAFGNHRFIPVRTFTVTGTTLT